MPLSPDYITNTFQSADELYFSPTIGIPAAQVAADTGLDPAVVGQSTAHATNQASLSAAATRVQSHHGNFLTGALNWVGKTFFNKNPLNAAYDERTFKPTVASGTPGSRPALNPLGGLLAGANTAGKPLQMVQHDYRYLRDVQARHGTLAFLAEALPMVAGGVVGGVGGAFVGSPAAGATLGAEAAGQITGRSTFQDSWDRTKDEHYRDPHGGQPVNFGEDAARLVDRILPGHNSVRRGTAPYSVIADATGVISTFALDPIGRVAKGLGSLTPGATRLLSPDTFQELAATNKGVQSVLDDLASKPAGQIAREYPPLTPFAKELGTATTREGVAQVFTDQLTQAEFKGTPLPTFPNNLEWRPPPTPDELASAKPIGRLALLGRRLTTQTPMTLTKDLDWSNTVLDPTKTDEYTVGSFEKLLKFGRQNNRVISALKEDYINGDVPTRVSLAKNGLTNAFLSMFKDPSPDLIAKARQASEDFIDGTATADGIYGSHSIEGIPAPMVLTDQGNKMAAAVLENERAPIHIPTFDQFRTAVNSERGATAVFGKLDDWAAKYVTKPFRIAALLTGGFAARIALAETIPAVLREGAVNLTKASINGIGAKLGYEFASEAEIEGVRATVAHTLSKLATGLGVKLSPELAETAQALMIANEGHLVPPAISSGSYVKSIGIGAEEANATNLFKMGQQTPAMRGTRLFEEVAGGEADQAAMWQARLKQFAKDSGMAGVTGAAAAYRDAYLTAAKSGITQEEAVIAATKAAVQNQREWIASLSPMDRSSFYRSKFSSDPAVDPLEDFAHVRVASLKGITHTPGADPHLNILDAIANGTTPDQATLNALPAIDRPLFVPGRVEVADQSGSWLARFSNATHEHVLGPIINTISREPQYVNAVNEQMDVFRPFIKSGEVEYNEALGIAQQRAVKDITRFIHNPADRVQFASLVRNFIPFYFAQEQSYRRFGRLLADDPAAFRKYQLAIVGAHDYVQHVKDTTGTAHVLLPGLGWLTQESVGLMGRLGLPVVGALPTRFLGNVTSLNTVLPFSEGLYPSWSPFVTIPAKAFEGLDPAMTPVMAKVLGPSINYSNNLWEALVPNTALRNLMSATLLSTDSRSYQSTMLSTYQAVAHRQEVAMAKWEAEGNSPDDANAPHLIPTPDHPEEWMDFMGKLQNQTRITYIGKALVSAISPLAPSVDIGDFKLKDELSQLIKKNGVALGFSQFLTEHPDATAYTIARSDSPKGQDVAPFAASQKFVEQHPDLFHNNSPYSHVASYFVPADIKGQFDTAAYLEQIAMGMRQRKDVKQFANDFWIAMGNHQFFETDYPVHKAEMDRLKNDPTARAAETANWNSYLTNTLAVRNPVWWEDFQNSAAKKNTQVTGLQELRAIFADGKAPAGAQSSAIQSLLQDWDAHQAEMAQGHAQGWSRDQRDAELSNWAAYTKNLVTESPWMSMVVNRVFKDRTAG